jgi:TusA-related sulfurtransferase
MKADEKLDCFGLLCPMPIIKTTQKMKEMKPGEVLEIIATDEGIKPDIKAWAQSTGNELLKIEEEEGEPTVYHVFVRKK